MKSSSSNLKWMRIESLIEVIDERNSANESLPAIGINKDKEFMPTVANLDGADLRKYKIVRRGYFVFSGMQTGRDMCIRIALFDGNQPSLISPAYTTFLIKANDTILPEYFFMYFNREEMDRYGAFCSDGSVRSNLDWDRFLDMKIPVPSIKEQQAVVDAWKSLRKIKEENEALAEPLMQLCQSYIQECKHLYSYKELDSYIAEVNTRNENDCYGIEELRGVTSQGVFEESRANTEGLMFSNYKIVKKFQFAYNPSRINLGSIALHRDEISIISPMYIVFEVVDENVLLPEFLALWTRRKEFQRSTLFYASGSVRDTFGMEQMRRALIPIPPIENQKAIVSLYNSALEYKKIAAEADAESRRICPALMQHVINN